MLFKSDFHYNVINQRMLSELSDTYIVCILGTVQVKVKAWNSVSALDQDAGNTTVVCLPELELRSNDTQNSVGFPSKMHSAIESLLDSL